MVVQRFLGHDPVMFLFSLCIGTLPLEIFICCCKEERSWGCPSRICCFSSVLAQSDPHTKVAYSGWHILLTWARKVFISEERVCTYKNQGKVTASLRLYTLRNRKADFYLLVCLGDKWKLPPTLQWRNALPIRWLKFLANSLWLTNGKSNSLWKPRSHQDKWLKQKRNFQRPCVSDLFAFIIKPQAQGAK